MPAIVASLILFIVVLVSLSASRNAYLANDLQELNQFLNGS
jgi:hypothetical protein